MADRTIAYDKNGNELAITIEDGLLEFDDEVKQNITRLITGNDLTALHGSMFDGADNLTAIYISKTIEIIKCGFYNANALISVVVDPQNEFYDSRDNCNAVILKDGQSKWPEIASEFGYDVTDYNMEGPYLIAGCAGTVIPEGVTVIAEGSICGIHNIDHLDIPASVKIIGEYPFCESDFVSISFTDGSQLQEIQSWAFDTCENLQTINIPGTVTEIGEYIFSGCSSMTMDGIQTSLTKISPNWLVTNNGKLVQILENDKTKLIELVIPNGTTEIPQYAFANCTSLITVSIPNSVTVFGQYCFKNVPSTCSYTVTSEQQKTQLLNSSSRIQESQITIIYPEEQTTTVMFSDGTVKKTYDLTSLYDVLDNVDYKKLKSIVSIKLGNTITEFNTGVYSYNLNNISCIDTTNSSIKNIIYNYEYPLSSLQKIIFGNTIEIIGSETFKNCTQLTSVNFGNNLCAIYDKAFYNVPFKYSPIESEETNFSLPDSLIFVGEQAFKNDEPAKVHVYRLSIPSALTSIGSEAFRGWNAQLYAIDVALNNPIYNCGGFRNSLIETQTSSIILGCDNTEISENIRNIKSYAFDNCGDLLSVYIPKSVTNIEQDAFLNCSNLHHIYVANDNPVYDSRNECNAIIETDTNTVIRGGRSTVIPNDATSIGPRAFQGVHHYNAENYYITDVPKLYIPASVSSIGEEAFYQYRTGDIGIVRIYGNDVEIKSKAFKWSFHRFIVEDSKTAYNLVNSDSGISFYQISVINDAQATKLYYKDGSIQSEYVDGTFDMYHFDNHNDVVSIDFGESVTAITYIAGDSLTSLNITSSISEISEINNMPSLKSISVDSRNPVYDSRNGCNAVIKTADKTLVIGCQATVIPNDISSIGDNAFKSSYGTRRKLTLDKHIKHIGSYAFSYNNLINADINGMETEFGSSPFSYQNNDNITIYVDVQQVKDRLVEAGEDEERIIVKYPPYTTVTYKDGALSNFNIIGIMQADDIGLGGRETEDYDDTIKSIKIGADVTEIAEGTFWYLSALESIEFSVGLTALDGETVSHCPKLTSFVIPDTVTSISKSGITVNHCDSLTSIDYRDFELSGLDVGNCANLKSISCTNLTGYVSYNMTYENCPKLRNIYVNNSELKSYTNGYGDDDAILVTTSGKLIYVTPCSELVDTQSYVTNIDEHAFESTKLKYLKIDNVTDLTGSTLCRQTELKYIHAENLSSISSMNYCYNIEGMYIPKMISVDWGNNTDYGVLEQFKAFDMSNIKYVGQNAFYQASSFNIISSNSITSIDDRAFGNNNLNTVILPNVKVLNGHYGEFCDCTNLKYVQLDSIEILSEHAFSYCPKLRRIDLPDSLLSIGLEYFYNTVNSYSQRYGYDLVILSDLTHVPVLTKSLTSDILSIVVADKLKPDFVQQWNMLARNIYSISEYSTNLDHRANPEADTSYVELWDGQLFDIDSSSNMHSQTFNYNDVVKIHFGSDLTSFTGSIDLSGTGSDRFERLRTIEFSDAAEFSDTAKISFQGCVSLISVDLRLDSAYNVITNYCFKGCESLLYAKMPNSVTSTLEGIFDRCVSLKTIDIGSSTTNIGTGWFRDCWNLTNIQNYVQRYVQIGDYAFQNCISFRNDDDQLNSIYQIGNTAFDGCINLSYAQLTDDTTEIDMYAFRNCWNLNLSTIEFAYIGDNAFENCRKLGQPEMFLNSVKIMSGAFKNCTSIHDIILNDLLEIENFGNEQPFKDAINAKTLTVSGERNILREDNITPGGLEKYCETVYIDTDHIAMSFVDDIDVYNMTLKTVYLGPELTSIGNNNGWGPTFQHCAAVTNVYGSNPIWLASGSFEGCSSLSSIEPTILGCSNGYGFKDCISLISVELSSNAACGSNMFAGCSSLVLVETDGSIYRNDGENMFAGCVSLERIRDIQRDKNDNTYVFDWGTIPDGAFANCRSLTTELRFPYAYKIGGGINESPFINCKSIRKISITGVGTSNEGGVIPISCFMGCDQLTCCEAPYALTVDNYAFAGCEKLQYLFADGVEDTNLYAVKRINKGSFLSCNSLTSINTKWCAYVGPSAFMGDTSLEDANISLYDTVGHDNDGVQEYYRVIIDDCAFCGCTGLTDVWAPHAKYIGTSAFAGTGINSFFNYNTICYANTVSNSFEDTYSLEWIQFRTNEELTLTDIKNETSNIFYGMNPDAYIIGSWWPAGDDDEYTINEIKNMSYIPTEKYLRERSEKWCEASAWAHLGIMPEAMPYVSTLMLEMYPHMSADYLDHANYLDMLSGQGIDPRERKGHGAPMWKYHARYDGYSMTQLSVEGIHPIYTHKSGMLYGSYDRIDSVEQKLKNVAERVVLSETGKQILQNTIASHTIPAEQPEYPVSDELCAAANVLMGMLAEEE